MKLFKSKNLYTIFLFFIAVSFFLYAKNKGMTGATLKNGEGCDCHGNQNKSLVVKIQGPESMKAGSTADFKVSIEGGPSVNGGVNIAVSSGNLIAGKGLKLSKKELTHIEPQKSVSGKLIFDFKLTAPSNVSEITIYAAGNSGNGNDTKKGDMWNFSPNKKIIVEE
jgi:predicted carbohydrate-binding protein with CBM5 and CBM33 domain